MKKYRVLDIFAGAGGLSLGFQQTGRFEIVAAFENNKAAKETYRTNHPNTVVYDNVLDASFTDLVEKHGPFDVIIGGPPCQGFSNANRQHNQLINLNNRLVKTYVEFILNLSPEVFLFENVKMLASNTHQFFYSKTDEEDVKKYKSFTTENLLIYNGDQTIPFINLLKDKSITWPNISIDSKLYGILRKVKRDLKKEIVSRNAITPLMNFIDLFCLKVQNNKLADSIHEIVDYVQSTEYSIKGVWRIVKIIEALFKLEDVAKNEIIINDATTEKTHFSIVISSYSVIEYINHRLSKKYQLNSGILNALNYGVPQNRERFIMIGVKNDYGAKIEFPPYFKNRHNVFQAICDLYNVEASDDCSLSPIQTDPDVKIKALLNLRDSKEIYNHIITKSSQLVIKRFSSIEQGGNFHSLKQDLISNYTDPSRTQNSIYFRLNENEPSATVTNVRKAMWIHPVRNRAVSVREAARLQSFPDSFIFKGSKDQQYQQVGNAVPPMLAKALAESILKRLDEILVDCAYSGIPSKLA